MSLQQHPSFINCCHVVVKLNVLLLSSPWSSIHSPSPKDITQLWLRSPFPPPFTTEPDRSRNWMAISFTCKLISWAKPVDFWIHFSPQFLANIYHIIPHLNITGAGHSFEQSNEGYEYFNPGFNLAKTNLRVPAKNSWHYFLIWLVVYLPLWKIWVRQLGSIIIFPTEWKKEFLFQTTNQW